MPALAGLAHVGEASRRDVHSDKAVRGSIDCDRIDHDLTACARRIGKGGENCACRGGIGASDSGRKGEGIGGIIESHPDHLAALISNFRTLYVAGFRERLYEATRFSSDTEK